jgi:hypothetical protein
MARLPTAMCADNACGQLARSQRSYANGHEVAPQERVCELLRSSNGSRAREHENKRGAAHQVVARRHRALPLLPKRCQVAAPVVAHRRATVAGNSMCLPFCVNRFQGAAPCAQLFEAPINGWRIGNGVLSIVEFALVRARPSWMAKLRVDGILRRRARALATLAIMSSGRGGSGGIVAASARRRRLSHTVRGRNVRFLGAHYHDIRSQFMCSAQRCRWLITTSAKSAP